MEEIKYYLALFFALTAFVIFGFIFYKRRKEKNSVLCLVGGMYVAIFILLFPGVKGPGRTFVMTMQMGVLNLEVEKFNELFGEVVHPDWFRFVYSGFLVILYVFVPILTATGILMTFVNGFYSWVRYKTTCRKPGTWFFSDPANGAILFAQDAQRINGRDLNIVFCNVDDDRFNEIVEMGFIPFKKKLRDVPDRYFRRRHISVFMMTQDEDKNLEEALAFIDRKNISRCSEGQGRNYMLYIFSGRPEAELILNSSDIQEKTRQNGIMCRRIDENRAIVYKEIMKISADLEKSLNKNRALNVLLFGGGQVGTELLKALIWMYGRETNDLHITVIDREDRGGKFARECPGFIEEQCDGRRRFTLPYDNLTKGIRPHCSFNLDFITCEDVFLFDLETIGDWEKTDLVYVGLGNDSTSLNYAIELRKQFRYTKRNAGEEIFDNTPKIRVVLKNLPDKKLDFEDPKRNKYHLETLLDDGQYYSVETLLNYELEGLSIAEQMRYREEVPYGLKWDEDTTVKTNIEKYILYQDRLYHDMREIRHDNRISQGEASTTDRDWWDFITEKDKQETAEDFYKYDYNMWSSRSAALYKKCIQKRVEEFVSLIENEYIPAPVEKKAEIWEQFQREEHWRWEVFMLTRGYHNNGKRPEEGFDEKVLIRDDIAGIHKNIIPFEDLTDETIRKDGY